MSDSNRLVHGCYSQEEIDQDARIAELEAELEIRDRISLDWIRRGEQAEAELARLKSGLLDNATFRRWGNP